MAVTRATTSQAASATCWSPDRERGRDLPGSGAPCLCPGSSSSSQVELVLSEGVERGAVAQVAAARLPASLPRTCMRHIGEGFGGMLGSNRLKNLCAGGHEGGYGGDMLLRRAALPDGCPGKQVWALGVPPMPPTCLSPSPPSPSPYYSLLGRDLQSCAGEASGSVACGTRPFEQLMSVPCVTYARIRISAFYLS